jgi:hypothetical protein
MYALSIVFVPLVSTVPMTVSKNDSCDSNPLMPSVESGHDLIEKGAPLVPMRAPPHPDSALQLAGKL